MRKWNRCKVSGSVVDFASGGATLSLVKLETHENANTELLVLSVFPSESRSESLCTWYTEVSGVGWEE